ncbi:unnamed protein product, partial [Staurois parvus]
LGLPDHWLFRLSQPRPFQNPPHKGCSLQQELPALLTELCLQACSNSNCYSTFTTLELCSDLPYNVCAPGHTHPAKRLKNLDTRLKNPSHPILFGAFKLIA